MSLPGQKTKKRKGTSKKLGAFITNGPSGLLNYHIWFFIFYIIGLVLYIKRGRINLVLTGSAKISIKLMTWHIYNELMPNGFE